MAGTKMTKRGMHWSSAVLTAAVLLLGGLTGSQVQAGACYGANGNATCQYEVSSYSIAPGNSTSMGIRFDAHTSNVLFDNFGNLAPRFMDNNNSSPLFIPQGTEAEFVSFINRADPNVAMDYAIAPSSYTAVPDIYASCGSFTPSSHALGVPLTSTVSGWLRMGASYITHPGDIKTVLGSTGMGSQLSYSFSRNDTLKDYEGNSTTAKVTFVQNQQVTIAAQGNAQNSPFFTWNVKTPALASRLYYALNDSGSYTPVADCSGNFAPPISGACGPAAGENLRDPPTSGLCSSGNTGPAVVTGSGPWSWTCSNLGNSGGITCQTGAVPVDGVCGSDANQTLTGTPTHLCSSGNASGLSEADSTTWHWSCSGTNGGNSASCSATAQSACIPTGQPVPPGQTQCPTKDCFLQVSGGAFVTPDRADGFTFSAIGKSINNNGVILDNMVGAGSYPLSAPSDLKFNVEDLYDPPKYNINDPTILSEYPLIRASYYTFDGMAIGNTTHVTIYSQPNYQGSVLFDAHGPYLLESWYYYIGAGEDMSDWTKWGGAYTQFVPSTRHIETGVSDTNPFGIQGMRSWGRGTSIKVTCD